MTRRASFSDYTASGIYHITFTVTDGLGPVLGQVVGNLSQPDGSPDAPRVELTAIGQMVEQQLTQSIPAHYPMVEIQDHIVMPDHLHAIIEVHGTLIGTNGRPTHLGQVIAGFKKGCNHGYWQLIGQTDESAASAAPAAPVGASAASAAPAALVGVSAERFPRSEPQATAPHAPYKVPSDASTSRTPLWNPGYCDVQPLRAGQLATQRAYIRANPRSRLLRMSNRDWLTARRRSIDTRLTLPALRGYMARECSDDDISPLRLNPIMVQLMVGNGGTIVCDCYGDRSLLERRLLPVVCHRKDKALRAKQLRRCFGEAENGAVLVSARIAPDEQAIIDAATEAGFPVVRVIPDGIPDRYHPSAELTTLCAAGLMLLVTPWQYRHRPSDEPITARECKTMNCVVQAICRLKDDWWKE